MCVKYFLRIHLFEELIAELDMYYVDMKTIQRSGLVTSTLEYTPTCITLTRNL